MMRAALLAGAAAVALSGCDRVAAGGDADFDRRVHQYIVSNPEVVEEAINALNQRRQAQADRQLALALTENRRALERDPRDFTANPNGRVTVTQFYDYRCPHCITVAPQVLEFIRANPDVRVVFKELPIFGEASDRAARLALEVRRRNGDYLGVYRDLTSARPLDDAAVDRIATAYGVAPAALNTPSAETAGQLRDVQALAARLRIDGTPTFVVGSRVIPGADIAAVGQAVAEARRAAS